MNTPDSCKIGSADELRDFEDKYANHVAYLKQQARIYAFRFRQEGRLQDLEQEGAIALIRAAKKFDPSKAKFITYFKWWLRLYLTSACFEWMYLIRIPSEQISVYSTYCRGRKAGRSNLLIAEDLGITPRKLLTIVRNVHNSQNLLTGEINDLDEHCSDLRDRGEQYFEPVENKMTNEYYLGVFQDILDPLEAIVVTRHFGFQGEPVPLNQLRYELWPLDRDTPVSRERLRQVKDSALRKLKDYFHFVGVDETGIPFNPPEGRPHPEEPPDDGSELP